MLTNQLTQPENPDVTVKVIATQWKWTYEYPSATPVSFDSLILEDKDRDALGKQDKALYPRLLAVDNELVVPVGKTVRVIVTAEPSDVIHAFAMQSFGVKVDAVPGRMNETWFKAEKEGINTMVEKLVGGNTGGGNASSNINDKLYVLQSNKIKMLAAKIANLQVRIESHGKISSLESYQNLPFQVILTQPDSAVDFKEDFTCDAQHRGLKINGNLYPFNQTVNVGGNALILQCGNPTACGDAKTKYTLSIFSLGTAAFTLLFAA